MMISQKVILLISRSNLRLTCTKRYLTTATHYDDVTLRNNNNNKWTGVINNAEKIVGYPTSFLNLRWLLSDEFANIAVHIKKLIGTNHPLLKTARNLLFQDEVPCFGLVVLLVAKMGGLTINFPDIDYDKSTGILHSQRVLAEVTEMVKMTNLIHKGVFNVDDDKTGEDKKNNPLYYGNKIALLTGDYLLSNAFRDLANIRNQEVNAIISTAQRDLVEAEFLGDRDCQNRPLPYKPRESNDCEDLFCDQFEDEPYNYTKALGYAKAEWTIRTLLSGGSLLAKACSSTLKLAGHDKYVRDNGHLVGKYFALTMQARQDKEIVKNGGDGEFCLINAPLMFHLQHEPSFYKEIERGFNNVDDIDYQKLRKTILDGPGIEMTNALIQENAEKTLSALNHFGDNGAKNALISLTEAMKICDKL